MDWESAWKIVGTAVMSVGGAGAIIAAVTKYAANHLSEKMLKKYDAKLSKDLEQYKHELELETEKYRNFHGLMLLKDRYEKAVDCVYIDPPYNANSSEILYKNSFKHAAWLTLIHHYGLFL